MKNPQVAVFADAPSATTATITEEPKDGQTATTISTLPDLDRGDRLTTKREDFRMVMQLFPKGEVKEMMYALVRWVVGETESVVYSEVENTLSHNAMFMLKTLIEGHKKRSHQYHQRVETKTLRAQRRVARARRTK